MNQQDIIAKETDIFWSVPEYEKHERTRNWYIIAGVIAVTLMVYALYTENYLFLGIIILGSFMMIMNDTSEPQYIPVIIGDEGIQYGVKFYDYDELRNFSVIYKPRDGVRNLYFEFKSISRPRIAVPLMDQDPLLVREALLRFIPEDLERIYPPASEGIAKMLKL